MGEKYWIYVLECEDNRYYVGQTKNLVKRFKRHIDDTQSQGSNCTLYFKPIKVIALYNVTENNKKEINKIENYITNHLRYINNDKWYKVNGGKYLKVIYDLTDEEYIQCKKDIETRIRSHPFGFYVDININMVNIKDISKPKELDNFTIERPICHCNLPSDVINDNTFICASKVSWLDKILYKNEVDLEYSTGCNFYFKKV